MRQMAAPYYVPMGEGAKNIKNVQMQTEKSEESMTRKF